MAKGTRKMVPLEGFHLIPGYFYFL